MINLKLRKEARKNNISRCRERNIILPTIVQMKDPESIPDGIKAQLKGVGLWDVNPLNLFRITWKNEPKDRGGIYGGVNYVEFPRELTGLDARIIALVGKWFPTGSHKVGATYGCLAPALVSGNFDSVNQKAVWPSTGNYCRGGAYNSALLVCESIAILPEEMSKERFDWLSNIAGEVIATPGCESNVKEIFDKCKELREERGDDIVIFNQFEEFGNYLWHYEVTGNAVKEVLDKEMGHGESYRGFVSSTGSAGTIAAGDFLKSIYPESKIAATEALQCPTLLRNGFGGHRIEGIGDKHVPWVHNVKNTDMVIAIDDADCMGILRLFNEEVGKDYLAGKGVSEEIVDKLDLVGISGISNLLGAIKFARYYELREDDVVVTILTDSMDLYESRKIEMHEAYGKFTRENAAEVYHGALKNQRIDNVLELSYYEKLRIHNLKYFTWIEQQGRTVEELNSQWYDRNYWKNIQKLTSVIDKEIIDFNKEVGL
ncbi:MAG TPA: pyridoxal-phosphate dependent enzyme [Spirochaetes bacterium]|nr:pyridoxal-phosphate dependent enzyme [Spirochaetota bacterium]